MHPQLKPRSKAPSTAPRHTHPTTQASIASTSPVSSRLRSATPTLAAISSPTKQSSKPQATSASPFKKPFAAAASSIRPALSNVEASPARAVPSAEKHHRIVVKETRLTSRRMDDFSGLANDIAANMNNTNDLLQNPSSTRSFVATTLMRDGVLSKAKPASNENQQTERTGSLRVSRLRPADDNGGPINKAAPLADRSHRSTRPALADLDDSTASIAAHLARRAGVIQGDAARPKPSAAAVPPTASAPVPTAQNEVAKPQEVAKSQEISQSQRLVSIDMPPVLSRIDTVQQTISRAIKQTQSLAATVNAPEPQLSTSSASTVVATKASNEPIVCSTACAKHFSLISELVAHIEEGDCGAIAVVDLYHAAVGCKTSHLFIWGRYHVDMDKRRDLKDKYLTNAW